MAQLQDYLDLIPPPNNIKPKYMQWVAANLQPYIDLQNFFEQMLGAFDIETAEGVQLDTIGDILDRSRTLDFTPNGALGIAPYVPVLINYDQPNTDLTIAQVSNGQVFIAGWYLVCSTAATVQLKSGNTVINEFHFGPSSPFGAPLRPVAPEFIAHTNVGEALKIRSNVALPRFHMYIIEV